MQTGKFISVEEVLSYPTPNYSVTAAELLWLLEEGGFDFATELNANAEVHDDSCVAVC